MTDCAAAPITLRPARNADAADCAAILNHWIDRTGWMAGLNASEAGRDGRAVVCLALDEGNAETTSFNAALQVKGVGAAKQGRARLSLWPFQANEGARRFYLCAEFSEGQRSEGGNDEGLPDVESRCGVAV